MEPRLSPPMTVCRKSCTIAPCRDGSKGAGGGWRRPHPRRLLGGDDLAVLDGPDLGLAEADAVLVEREVALQAVVLHVADGVGELLPGGALVGVERLDVDVRAVVGLGAVRLGGVAELLLVRGGEGL